VGALLAIAANAYLATGLLFGVFIFYAGLQREWQALRAGKRMVK
jgi:hypothetical protein